VAQEVDLSVGNGLGVGGKVYRKLGGRTFVNMSGTLQFARGGTRPAFSCSLGNYLDKHTGTAPLPDPNYGTRVGNKKKPAQKTPPASGFF
jgi:hypothetical protein